MMCTMDRKLETISEKVYSGQRLSADDGLALLRSEDLGTIGQLASHVRHQRHGRKTYYNINRHINYSNVCALSCKFCAFYRKKGQDGAYEYSASEIAEQARSAQEGGRISSGFARAVGSTEVGCEAPARLRRVGLLE